MVWDRLGGVLLNLRNSKAENKHIEPHKKICIGGVQTQDPYWKRHPPLLKKWYEWYEVKWSFCKDYMQNLMWTRKIIETLKK